MRLYPLIAGHSFLRDLRETLADENCRFCYADGPPHPRSSFTRSVFWNRTRLTPYFLYNRGWTHEQVCEAVVRRLEVSAHTHVLLVSLDNTVGNAACDGTPLLTVWNDLYRQILRILRFSCVEELVIYPVNRRSPSRYLRGPAVQRFAVLARFVNRQLRNLSFRDRRIHVPASLDHLHLRDGVHYDHEGIHHFQSSMCHIFTRWIQAARR